MQWNLSYNLRVNLMDSTINVLSFETIYQAAAQQYEEIRIQKGEMDTNRDWISWIQLAIEFI